MSREASCDQPWWAAASDRGPRRSRNEDAFAGSADGLLLVVADGMGGHDDGAEAARLACEAIAGAQGRGHAGPGDAAAFLERAVRGAHRRVREAGDPESAHPMGTTVVAVFLGEGGRVTIAHVGDSRAYLVRGGRAQRLTGDHSVVADMVREGSLAEADSRHHPLRNRLTRAVGIEDGFACDVVTLDLPREALLVLCTDGLWECIEDDELARALEPRDAAQAMADRLVALALSRDADDNATALVVDAARLWPVAEASPTD